MAMPLMSGAALAVVVVVVASVVSTTVDAQVHHVVGGDVGWEPSTDIPSWAADKIFRVGDNIWFAYSAARESVVELRNKHDYESCDVSNPIRIYGSGIDAVPLEEEGIRYFASSRVESCKGGLRLPVEVHPRLHPMDIVQIATSEAAAAGLDAADGPASPSGSHKTATPLLLSVIVFIGIQLWRWAV